MAFAIIDEKLMFCELISNNNSSYQMIHKKGKKSFREYF